MPYRKTHFANGEYYHLFNRGVNRQTIFTHSSDYYNFLDTLDYYRFQGPKPSFSTRKRFKLSNYKNNQKIIGIVSYCLMPNHFHILAQQLTDGGIQEFMRKTLNSYTKYFNTLYKRIGPLLQGEFRAVHIDSDEQLLHVSRYIHLNPSVSGLTENLDAYPYSSYPYFLNRATDPLCDSTLTRELVKSPQDYQQFVMDQEAYAHELELIKHATLDEH